MRKVALIMFISVISIAQTTLSPGDIAVTGYNSDGDDQISFVLLKGIVSTTVIRITDNNWSNTTSSFSSTEGGLTFTATSNLDYGTQITITQSGASWIVSSGTVVEDDAGFLLSTSGDVIYLYQGATATPAHLTAVDYTSGTWDADELPGDLTDGDDAIAFTHRDNGSYTLCAKSSDAATLRGLIYNSGNWTFDNDVRSTLPPCSGDALPVELVEFTGNTYNNSVELFWLTATETNNASFEVQRLVSDWRTLTFIPGAGNSNSPKNYSYTDSDLPNAEKVSYRLKQIDNDGTTAYSKVVEVDLTSITGVEDQNIKYEFALNQNYPNPFNPTTTINFTLPGVETGHVPSLQAKLTVFNLLGQAVITLVNEAKPAGQYEVQFDASSLPSGIYFYTLNYGSFNQTRKLILMK